MPTTTTGDEHVTCQYPSTIELYVNNQYSATRDGSAAHPLETIEQALSRIRELGYDNSAIVHVNGASISGNINLSAGNKGAHRTPVVIQGPARTTGISSTVSATSTNVDSELYEFSTPLTFTANELQSNIITWTSGSRSAATDPSGVGTFQSSLFVSGNTTTSISVPCADKPSAGDGFTISSIASNIIITGNTNIMCDSKQSIVFRNLHIELQGASTVCAFTRCNIFAEGVIIKASGAVNKIYLSDSHLTAGLLDIEHPLIRYSTLGMSFIAANSCELYIINRSAGHENTLANLSAFGNVTFQCRNLNIQKAVIYQGCIKFASKSIGSIVNATIFDVLDPIDSTAINIDMCSNVFVNYLYIYKSSGTLQRGVYATRSTLTFGSANIQNCGVGIACLGSVVEYDTISIDACTICGINMTGCKIYGSSSLTILGSAIEGMRLTMTEFSTSGAISITGCGCCIFASGSKFGITGTLNLTGASGGGFYLNECDVSVLGNMSVTNCVGSGCQTAKSNLRISNASTTLSGSTAGSGISATDSNISIDASVFNLTSNAVDGLMSDGSNVSINILTSCSSNTRRGITASNCTKLIIRTSGVVSNNASGIQISKCSRSCLNNISGTGNTDYGVQLLTNSECAFSGTMSIAGTAAPYKIGTNAAGANWSELSTNIEGTNSDFKLGSIHVSSICAATYTP
jgi:hypothetical protein